MWELVNHLVPLFFYGMPAYSTRTMFNWNHFSGGQTSALKQKQSLGLIRDESRDLPSLKPYLRRCTPAEITQTFSDTPKPGAVSLGFPSLVKWWIRTPIGWWLNQHTFAMDFTSTKGCISGDSRIDTREVHNWCVPSWVLSTGYGCRIWPAVEFQSFWSGDQFSG